MHARSVCQTVANPLLFFLSYSPDCPVCLRFSDATHFLTTSTAFVARNNRRHGRGVHSPHLPLTFPTPSLLTTSPTPHSTLHPLLHPFAGHFIRAGDEARTNPKSILRSLAYQAAANCRAAEGPIREAVRACDWTQPVKEIFDAVLLTSLSSLPAPPTLPMVVLLDAVDEGRSADGKHNDAIALLRTHLTRLPSWVRIVATGRPEADVLGARAQLESCRPEELLPSDEQNLEDLRAFVRERLSESLSDAEREEAVDVLLERSEGVIAWVAKVAEVVMEGHDMGRVALGELPKGLGALYEARD